MSPEVSSTENEMSLKVPMVEDVLTSEAFMKSDAPLTYIQRKLLVGAEEIKKVAAATIGQRTNPMWAAVRKLRLTASNFGALLQAVRLNRYIILY